MSKENQEDMKGALAWFLELIHKQGAAIAILVWVAMGQQEQIKALQSSVKDCNQQTLEIVIEREEKLVQVLERNTKAFENFGHFLKNQESD